MGNKFNWGHGIALFYVVFVGIVITALVASFGVDHSLVVDDYYATDIAYQSTYDKTKNSMESSILSLEQNRTAHVMNIEFDTAKTVKGTAHWYRPSDKSADFVIPLTSASTEVSTAKLLKGKWVLKIEWTIDGKTSYTEEQIFVS